jgi:DNA polymerase-3 subunit epsilon
MLNDKILNTPLSETTFSVLDVETTGLSARDNKIIEIGLVKVENLKIMESYHSLINPGRLIPYFITSFTGITNDDVFDAPFFEDIVDELEEFIGYDIISGHNLTFDKSFLKKEFISCGKEFLPNFNVCTLKIARRLFPNLRSKSLGSLSNFLRIKNRSAHRALGDAQVTARILIKIINQLHESFDVETVGDLINFQFNPRLNKSNTTIKKKLGEDVSGLPDAPGIYYFLNSRNEIIYIGKAKSLRERVKSYFSPTAQRKAKAIIKQASRLRTEITNTELTALLTEAELIKIIKPRHNTQLRKYGSKYFLRVMTTHKFPAIEISNHFDFDGNDYFGLFISKKKAAEIYELLNKTFAIRECTDKEFSKGKACFLAEIDRCTAPCINSDLKIYNSELEKLYEFLYGKNQFALTRLIIKMKEYSSKQKYEKAGEVKQLIDLILSQSHKSSILAEPVNSANVLFEVSGNFAKDYVVMLAGKIYVKKYVLKEEDRFEQVLDDYFEHTININPMPDDEDLEKMKITLNWLIKNRSSVRVFYLKEYRSKAELYSRLSSFGNPNTVPVESNFNIRELLESQF